MRHVELSEGRLYKVLDTKTGHPEMSRSKRLVELGGVEPPSENRSSLALHA
jgi:hypothetical protein